MQADFDNCSLFNSAILVIPVFDDLDISAQSALNDDQPSKFIRNLPEILSSDPKFKGKAGQSLVLPVLDFPYTHVLVFGMGKREALSEQTCENLGSSLFKALSQTGFEGADISGFGLGNDKMDEAAVVAHMANGAMLKSYKFDKYLSKKDDAKEMAGLHFLTDKPEAATQAFDNLKAVTDGVFFARDLANEPPNVLYPESYADKIKEAFAPFPNVKVTVLDEDAMQMKKMGAILAVGQGSERESRMVIVEYNGLGDGDKSAPLALVGKGVTFDSGGISLKPGPSMDEMKFDMGGSAAVIGAMLALVKRNAKTRVVGAVGLVENMPDGKATKPGDILTAMDGTTIEIINTDAEGRLVLADTLTYVGETYKPHTMIDLATLTGACVAALGHEFSGVFTPNKALGKKIEQAGNAVQEKTFPMPLDQAFKTAIKGTYADLRNLGGQYAGASTAAEFVLHFNRAAQKAHIDIAGMAWNMSGHPLMPDRIGTGYGVRLLDRLVRNCYEQKPTEQKPENDNGAYLYLSEQHP